MTQIWVPKYWITLALFCLLLSACAWDGDQGGNYGISNRHHVLTIANALRLRDGSDVTIRGYIVGSSATQKYRMKDNTGKVIVYISDDIWDDLTVDSYTKVEVQGNIVRDGEKVTIDAYLVKLSR